MQGNKEVVCYLNKILAAELTAMDQYFIHARMYEDWGYKKLAERIIHEMSDEQEHARLLIDRILFLQGTPDIASREPLQIGATVPEMLANDLKLELAVVETLRKSISFCESMHDYTSSQILRKLLLDTEIDHTLWLEQQLGHIARLGLERYLMTCL